MSWKSLLLILLLAGTAAAAEGAQVFFLWPNGAPGSEGKSGEEKIEPPNAEHGYTMLSNVHKPSLTVFLPAKEIATGAAVVICPGGAHRFLATDIEGEAIGKFFASIGVAGFMLKYRLAREEGSTYTIEGHSLADAQRAIRTVRARAKEWGIDPARVGIMGFSAGGAVAALAATRFDSGQPDAADPIERMGSRPDFQILIYPGFRPDSVTITKDVPPAFLLTADDDRRPAQTITELYPLLKEAGVSVEMHIYASGGHGFGIRNPPAAFPVSRTWQLRLADWMGDRGLLWRP
jgi:endo-1,4-beta-xylanase